MTNTETITIDGAEVTLTTTDCVNCGERIAQGSVRGTRAWRHMLTLSGMCASGETCADPR